MAIIFVDSLYKLFQLKVCLKWNSCMGWCWKEICLKKFIFWSKKYTYIKLIFKPYEKFQFNLMTHQNIIFWKITNKLKHIWTKFFLHTYHLENSRWRRDSRFHFRRHAQAEHHAWQHILMHYQSQYYFNEYFMMIWTYCYCLVNF